MGTTKDPEGFRRHTAGRGDVLGVKGGGAKRRGCGLGVALLAAALGLGAAASALLVRTDRDGRVVVAAAPPESASIHGPRGPVPDDLAPSRSWEALPRLPESEGDRAQDRRRALTESSGAHLSASEPSALTTIRLLRGWSQAPFAEAEVFWIGRSELARLRKAGLTITTVELGPVLRRRGRHVASGPDGLLRVAADGCHLLVVGDGWTRELELAAGLLGITDVRVFEPRTLVVEVVDWRGARACSPPVELWRVDALGQPQQRLYKLPTSSATGLLRFEDVDSVLRPRLEAKPSAARDFRGPLPAAEPPAFERTRLRVALDPDLAPAAWAEIDLAQDPLPHVRLQFPPLGELRVLVAQGDGRPVAWRGRVELQLAGDGGSAFTQELVDGRAEFGNLPFGRGLRVRALRADGAKGPECEVPALTPDEHEREIVLSDFAPLPRLVLRPLHPDGFALPRTWCNVLLQAQRPPTETEAEAEAERRVVQSYRLAERILESRGGIPSLVPDGVIEVVGRPLAPESSAALRTSVSHGRSLLTDAGGYVELPLPGEFLEWTEVTVVVSLVRDGATLSSAPRRLERGEGWTDMDLGGVALLRPEPQPTGSEGRR